VSGTATTPGEVQLDPGALGPNGYFELRPGLWFADPSSPTFVPDPPKFPLALGEMVRLDRGASPPSGYMELSPGVWHPAPSGFGSR
jgi:hypothetical protein